MKRPSLPLVAWLAIVSPVFAAQKYLIEFGWDEPTTAFMRQHATKMERTPFDGTVFHLEATNADGTTVSFMNQCWSTRKFTDAELKGAEDNLRATLFTKFTQNFLRFNVCPADLDWFDDYSAVMHNARQAARIASASGCAGILFDVEEYNAPLWDYRKQKLLGSKSFAAYAARVEEQGAAFVQALQDGWAAGGSRRPLVVFQTYGYSLAHEQAEGDRTRLEKVDYGLLAPFMDGMYAAAADATKIVDGFEPSYGYKTEKQFSDARHLVLETVTAFAKDPAAYRKHTSLGMGFWIDYDWRKKGWDETDPTKNYFTPAQLESILKLGLRTADQYIWIYTEKPLWWSTTSPTPLHLPAAYIDAVRHAKESVAP